MPWEKASGGLKGRENLSLTAPQTDAEKKKSTSATVA